MSLHLPKHPIPMRTVFRRCFLVNFAVDPDVLKRHLEHPIVPEIHGGSAFLSVVIADMERMRPAFVPTVFGVSFTQVVYRAVVKCQGERGVHFLRSDANNRLMCALGNALTFFHFNFSRVQWKEANGHIQFDLAANPLHHADIHACFDLSAAEQCLPDTSRFTSLQEAKEFRVELYSAFDSVSKRISRVRIRRGDWNTQVVRDWTAVYEFMNGGEVFPTGSAVLDSVFYVRDLPYYWNTLDTLPI